MSSEFEITILASGSKGNAAVIRAGEQAFLVDVGISCRQLTERLHQAGMKPEDLTGVLLTQGSICRKKVKWNAAAAAYCPKN